MRPHKDTCMHALASDTIVWVWSEAEALLSCARQFKSPHADIKAELSEGISLRVCISSRLVHFTFKSNLLSATSTRTWTYSIRMFTSSIATAISFAALAGLAAASPVPQAQPGSTDQLCFPAYLGRDAYIQAHDTGNRLWVSDNTGDTSPLSSLVGGQTKWQFERTGYEPNEYHIK